MQKNLPSVYDPKEVEDKWYEFWEKENLFHAEIDSKKRPFTIVIPPPNVTGQLHMGHALNNTLQDILIRTKRMQGYSALWLPGTDHAGIATEAKVKEQLADEGLSKYDLGREKFLERVWEWKEKYGDTIINQLKKLGSSCDWSRLRFTMDEGLSKAVREVFVRLYEKGLIYRGHYIVNWCPTCKTTLSDIEVEHEDRNDKLYYVKYPYKDGSGYLTVATTRPETILGDTAVAVNPNDERYKGIIGKTVILPIVEKEIPVIGDSYVDTEFGTGAVKVTPGHDPNDFEMGLRHSLPIIIVIDDNGIMNDNAGKFKGMDRFDCRKAIVEELQQEGFFEKMEDLNHSVGHCYRCHTIVEPVVSKQWFVKMEPLAKPAIDVVKQGEVKFVPERFAKIYLNWLENIRDWCISRQLWWGHRIPAWYCQECGETMVSRDDVKVCTKCGSSNIEQDPDVLDTWFSSALWPFSTLGWPEDTPDLKYFYPTSVLVTAYDIIFFWVARMIFSAMEFMKKPPFEYVVITGLVRDAQGRKMSKSLGNGIDPLEVIDKYGADTLRFTLCTGNAPGNDMRFYWEKVESSRNFANKIWNASRFIMMNLEDFTPGEIDLSKLALKDRWILKRINDVTRDVTDSLEKFEIGMAAQKIYDFFWNEFCDWYIEMAKIDLYGKNSGARRITQLVLVNVVEQALKLLHPFMPFITEEIWQHISREGLSIMVSSWPEYKPEWEFEDVDQMELVMDAVRGIRNIRAEMNVPPSKQASALVRVSSSSVKDILRGNLDIIYSLAKVSKMEFGEEDLQIPHKAVSCVIKGAEIFIPMEGLVDLDTEIARLEKEKSNLKNEIERVNKKLSNQGFLEKAPQDIVEKEQQKQKDYQEMLQKVEQRLKMMADLSSK
ncbi:valyl-tRNA synthetase [Tepidanaerobacter acetatoxydans Re1]|uniref:Valine--tRNA ligase n=1 Tax=Tepidanaerobacter acetatoxydans (strain DSM 21804 / JCM 16047 / Re1) TaxID=1209989 RepID=F4LVX8_TEPAE|nr:valine--tRNA ligase [Tepidanaerobacter acetatoxydans]AEE91646.1 Valyl-tRNA synthetase [Tepidanaerobacter acetatoxydans Re1]CCP26388.1 valyl-tRNA synthetase [Tepidanaerobacter acetatoxydans Re1]